MNVTNLKAIFDGKSPADRNKIIAASVLGLLAFVAIFYNVYSSFSTTTPTRTSSSPKAKTEEIKPISQEITDNPDWYLTPLNYTPFVASAPDPTRNIFAQYVPPPPAPPKPVVEPPQPTPTPIPPPPPPPMQIAQVNPTTVFARTADFEMQVVGDKFTAETRVSFGGIEVPTQFVNAQQLTAKVPANLIATEGQRQIAARTPDNKLYSNPFVLNVQAPPVPNYNFVGLNASKRFNNTAALLQNKQTKEYKSVRLSDTVDGRFAVASIAGNEITLLDTSLKIRHKLPYQVEESRGGSGGGSSASPIGGGNGFGRPAGFQNLPAPNALPNNGVPGNPDNIPRYIPPAPQASPTEDDDDEDNPN